MIRDPKPYSAYKDSGVPWLGDVPEHWEVGRLKNAAANVIQQTDSRAPGEVYLALENVESWTGRIITRAEDVSFDSQVKRFKANDVLFGKLRPYLAKVTRPAQAGVCVGEFLVLRPRNSQISAAYLEQLLRSKPVVDVINSSTFGAKMPRADWDFIGNMRIVIPPSEEQSAIDCFLKHMDRRIRYYIRAKQRLIKLIEEERQVLIHSSITRGVNPTVNLKASGIDWLGDIPSHWSIQRAKNLFRLRTQKSGHSHGLELLSIYTHIGVRPRRELEERGNKASTTDDYWIVKKGDIIVNKLLAWMGAVGVSKYDGVTSPAYDILMPIRDLDPDFYHLLFRTKLYLQQFKQRSRGIMDMRLRLYFDQLGQILLLVPPVKEQSAIVAYCAEATAELDRAIEAARSEISLLHEFHTRLIADVVTGKLDVREAAANLPDEVEGSEELSLTDEAFEDGDSEEAELAAEELAEEEVS